MIPEEFRQERRLGALVGLAFLFAALPSGCVQAVGNDVSESGLLYFFFAALFLFGAALERLAERARTPGPAWLERGYVVLMTTVLGLLYASCLVLDWLRSTLVVDLVAIPAGVAFMLGFRLLLERRRLPGVVVLAAAAATFPLGVPAPSGSFLWFVAMWIVGFNTTLLVVPVLLLVGPRRSERPGPGWEAWLGTAVVGGLLGLSRFWAAMVAGDDVTMGRAGEVYRLTEVLTVWWLFTLGPTVIERLWTPRSELSRFGP